MLSALLIVAACVACTLLLGWWYFARCLLTRPPLGVINAWDVATMMGGILVAPLLYIDIPSAVATAILGIGALSLLYAVGEPLIRARWALWLTVLVLEGADIATGLGHTGVSAWLVNDVLIILLVIGLANLWAQGGMSARALAVLAAFLTIYDLAATSWLPLTSRLTSELGSGPFAPLVGWGLGREHLDLGLGDLVLATLFPLVMRKAFGDAAGATALALALSTLVALMIAVRAATGAGATVIPVMAALGPAMLLHYSFWARRCGEERTTAAYRRAHANSQVATPPSGEIGCT